MATLKAKSTLKADKKFCNFLCQNQLLKATGYGAMHFFEI